ncbi:MAG TPA: hypothetical protein PK366_05900 [Fibrobacteraceae bacterium]|nr:hypothetical protein [Fibrobacteraceae bacterium]
MIQLNLIEAASQTASLEAKVQVKLNTKNKTTLKSHKILIAFGSVAAVLVLFAGSLILFGLPKPLHGVIPEAVLSTLGVEDPSREALLQGRGKAQMTTAGGLLEKQREAERAALLEKQSISVENIVQGVSPKMFNQTVAKTHYSNYLPLEQIAYQNAALSQLLVFINTATPDNISFSDLIFEAPNYYYVRGVAENPSLQRSFLERIKAVSSSFKTPTLPENAPVTDITAFGEYNVAQPNLNAHKSLVSADGVAEELKHFAALDVLKKIKFSGLDKPKIEDYGVFKKYFFKASTNIDYISLMNFIVELQKSPVRLGVQKLEMVPGKKNLAATLHLVMYVAP